VLGIRITESNLSRSSRQWYKKYCAEWDLGIQETQHSCKHAQQNETETQSAGKQKQIKRGEQQEEKGRIRGGGGGGGGEGI
jgi:hypothetical protein